MKTKKQLKKSTLFFKLFIVAIASLQINFVQAQTSESCDCTIDTLGLKSYLSTLTLNENIPLKFEVSNSSSLFAVLHGYIDATTPAVVQTFINTYPNVTTLVFMQMPGSDDDNANLIASQNLKNQGYKFYLPSVNAYSQDAFIASGAVDMFLAGNTRVIDVGAEVGVHSWSDGTNDATNFPVGHTNHLPYINYYVSMGFSQADAETFYYFTINAAPASSVHNMTESEIETYKLRTCKYAATPIYTTSTNGNVVMANLSGANSYQWIECDDINTPISGATSPNFTPTNNGNYAVEITENSCSGTSSCVSITTVGINDTSKGSYEEIYPNPSNGTFTILQKKESAISVFSSTGVLIKFIANPTKQSIIDLSKEKSGLYFIKTSNGLIKKLILK